MNVIISDLKAPAQQKKLPTKQKGTQPNGKRYLQRTAPGCKFITSN